MLSLPPPLYNVPFLFTIGLNALGFCKTVHVIIEDAQHLDEGLTIKSWNYEVVQCQHGYYGL
jgi:hypothetical protein